MADVTFQPTEVLADANAARSDAVMGEVSGTTAGMVVYRDAGQGNQLKRAVASAEASAAAVGILLNTGSTPQPVKIATSGIVDFGPSATFVQGGVYVVSQTGQGGIAPDADIIAGGYKTVLGVALDSRRLALQIQVSGVPEV